MKLITKKDVFIEKKLVKLNILDNYLRVLKSSLARTHTNNVVGKLEQEQEQEQRTNKRKKEQIKGIRYKYKKKQKTKKKKTKKKNNKNKKEEVTFMLILNFPSQKENTIGTNKASKRNISKIGWAWAWASL